MKPTATTNPQIPALDAKIDAARAELTREDTRVATAASTRESTAASTRAAASAYAEAPSPELLAAHRTAKEAARAAGVAHDEATTKRDRVAEQLEQLEQLRQGIVAAEAAEAARQKAAEVAAATRAQRLHATAADRAHLEQLAAGLGREAFIAKISPAISKIVRARLDLDDAIAEIRAARDAQPERYAEALALHAEIGEPAPPAPPAPVGDPAERIAYVLVSQALGEAYAGEAAENLADWIEVRSFPLEADRARWAIGRLGFDGGAIRRHTDPVRALDLILVHGADLGREAEGKAQIAEELAGLAAIVETHRDPVLKARAALHELTRSLPDAHDLGRAPERLAREKHLAKLILEGAHTLACWEASGEAKKSTGVYKAPGERGTVHFSRVAPDARGNTPDALAFALGIRDLPEHAAVRGFLGIAGKKRLEHIIAPVPAAPPAAPLPFNGLA